MNLFTLGFVVIVLFGRVSLFGLHISTPNAYIKAVHKMLGNFQPKLNFSFKR